MSRRHPLLILAAVVSAAALPAFAQEPVPLDGTTVTLPECRGDDCVTPFKLIYEYAEDDSGPDDVFSIGVQCSPWRAYDGDGRILDLAQVGGEIRSHPKYRKSRTVELQCSWSGVKAEGATATLAEQLGAGLDKPTRGMDGFLWMGPKSTIKTTRQSFTAFVSGYTVKRGEFVMVSAAYALPDGVADKVEAQRDPEGLRYVALCEDIFRLRPDHALRYFELAARYGDNIGAYNAAVMRLDRGEHDRARAHAKAAADRGDEKAAALLKLIP